MTLSSLSPRGALAAETPLRVDYAAFQEAEADRYHPTRNPDGAIPLNVAENRLSWPELRERIQEVTRNEDVPDWVPAYTSARGAPEFRSAVAEFLEEHLTGCATEPGSLAVSAGATGVIEMTAFVLAGEGDVAAIPAPCYPVYSRDLGSISGVERYDVVTHHEPSDIVDGPALRIEHLERARRDIEAGGKRFRMLVLTTPDNPTGGIHRAERLAEMADWCIDHEVHLVVNEIYGLSLIDTGHPDLREDYPDDVRFSSFAPLIADRNSDYLHLWYAFSKDLGISGLRVGLVHSRNADFLRAYGNLNLTHSVSNHTQWLLGEVITDKTFMRGYLARNQERLTESYAIAVRALREAGIPYVPSRGSHFVWLDLSELLSGDGERAERELWDDLFRTSGVLLTPGIGFGHTKRGMFRLVYPCVAPEELEVAMKRLGEYVEAAR